MGAPKRNGSSAGAFGQLLRDYRERIGYSQRKLASILGVDDSTVARLESGTRKPPRDATFYERLRSVPGVTEAEVAQLLQTDNAPAWLIQHRGLEIQRDEVEPAPDMPRKISAGGLNVSVAVSASPEVADIETLIVLEDVVGAHVELVLREFLRHRHVVTTAVQERLAIETPREDTRTTTSISEEERAEMKKEKELATKEWRERYHQSRTSRQHNGSP